MIDTQEFRAMPSIRPIIFVVAGAMLALGACAGADKPAQTADAAPIRVTTARVTPTRWVDTIEAVGTSKARESVTLTAKITETVRKVNFSDGQNVGAGDVLVELTSGQQVAALAEAQATFRDAERLKNRNQDLVRQGTVSRQVFDTSQATNDSTQARVNVLRAQLSDRVVTAPFAGVLGLRQISAGALVTPGTVITTLDDIDTIKIDFALSERYMSAVAAGQQIVATSAAFAGREFNGTITSLDSRVDPVTRAIQVRAEIANSDHALRAGMLLTVKVLQPAREVLVVPEIAIVQIANESSVFRVGADDTVVQVKVGLGARRRGEVEITEGLEAGSRIVVDGTLKLRDGARISESAAPPPAKS